MKEFIRETFVEHGDQGFILFTMITIIISLSICYLYRKFYEKKINQVLEGKKVHIISIEAVMIGCLIFAVVNILLYTGIVYHGNNNFASIEEEIHGYVGCDIQRKDIYEEMEKLKKESRKSFSYQEFKNEDGTISMYAENEDKYVSAFVIPLDYSVTQSEYFYVQVGAGVYELKHEKNMDEIIIKHAGTFVNKENENYVDVYVYNFTEGENKHPLDIKKKIYVHKGGIKIK